MEKKIFIFIYLVFGFLLTSCNSSVSSLPDSIILTPSLLPSSNNLDLTPTLSSTPPPEPGSNQTSSVTPSPIGTLSQSGKATLQAQTMLTTLQTFQRNGYLGSTNGTYHKIEDREIILAEPNAREVGTIEGYYLSNFILNAQISWSKPSSKVVNEDNTRCGFAFHLTTDGDYEFKIRLDGKATLHRTENDTQYSFNSILINQQPYRQQFSTDGQEDITLIVYNKRVIVLINEREIFNIQEEQLISTPYDKGLLAFLAENNTLGGEFRCAWTNVQLWELATLPDQEAVASFATPIPTVILDAESYYNLGISHYQKGDYASAIESFTKSIDLMPDVYVSYYARGVCYFARANYIEALSDFNQAIERNPSLGVIYYRRGQVYQRMGDDSKAQADFIKANDLGYSQ